MIILGIETSCDETAAAVLQKSGNRITILSNVVASSSALQAKYGGIIPEQAAREQIKSIIPVIEEALHQAFPKERLPRRPDLIGAKAGIQLFMDPPVKPEDDIIGKIDAIAVTYGPGLIGSLLVGVETAKTLAIVWKKPLIPVNHLLGHFYANWISPAHLRGVRAHLGGVTPSFPCIGLLVSGGHTDLVLFTNHGKYKYLGGTRDDAAGECFDKCARLLGLPYPGGPAIAQRAMEFKNQNSKIKIELPRPMIEPSFGWDFSFSGLKTAVANIIHTSGESEPTPEVKCNFAASIEQAIVDVLVAKTIRAAQTYRVDQIMIAGGVASNQKLVSDLKLKIENFKLKIKLHVPPPELCTDNAAMIAASAFFNNQPVDPLILQAEPNLSLSFPPRVVAM